MESASHLADGVLSIIGEILQYLNPLSLEGALSADAFVGYVGLGIAFVIGAFVYPVMLKMMNDEGKAIGITILIGFVAAGSTFQRSKNEVQAAEAICIAMGGAFRFIEGLTLVNCLRVLFGEKSLRGNYVDRSSLFDPIPFVFTVLLAVFLLGRVDLERVSIGLKVWCVITLLGSFLSFAGLTSIVKSTFRSASANIPTWSLASGICLWMLLTCLYAPSNPAHKVFYLVGYPVGAAAAITSVVVSRR